MRSVLALTVLAIAASSRAQDQYNIDPDSVSLADRNQWCVNQRAQCPLICLQQANVTSSTTLDNECDPETLVYSCTCENGISPNLTAWSQTIPYYKCTEWGNQCVTNCNGVQSCQSDCREKHPCGAQDAYKGNGTVATSATTTSPAASETSKTSGGFTDPNANKNGNGNKGAASSMLNLGASYSLAVVFSGVFLGFAVLL